MTVAGNVSFPLSYKGLSKAQAAAATADSAVGGLTSDRTA